MASYTIVIEVDESSPPEVMPVVLDALAVYRPASRLGARGCPEISLQVPCVHLSGHTTAELIAELLLAEDRPLPVRFESIVD